MYIEHDIDIALISKTRFTGKRYLSIRNCCVYEAKHPSGRAQGGTAVITKKSEKHNEIEKYSLQQIQATSVVVEDWVGPVTFSSVYSLSHRFVVGGDLNAKHTKWGSKLINPKGRNLLKAMQRTNLDHISTGEPTYWPNDVNKLPDL